MKTSTQKRGTVYLVGGGPGDPELLTVKAARTLSKADVVVFDRLVSPDIVDLVPDECTRVYVGKQSGNHTLPQERINDLLVKLALTNERVVRLKGGDPYIFGRGSEEALYLAENKIPFEIIPGITAAAGISAATGIPLTHRGLATGTRFVTGHGRDGTELDLNWKNLADADTTLVLYMGLAKLPELSARLVEAGLSPDTPAAAIANGTQTGQRQCVSTLAGLPSEMAGLGFSTPVLFLIGRVVELAHELNWQGLVYESISPESENTDVVASDCVREA